VLRKYTCPLQDCSFLGIE